MYCILWTVTGNHARVFVRRAGWRRIGHDKWQRVPARCHSPADILRASSPHGRARHESRIGMVMPKVVLVVLVTALFLAPEVVGGQAVQTRAARVKAATADKAWTPARTSDGQPDLQGMWTNATITPFERPSELAGKAF